MLAYRVVSCSHQSDRRIRECILHQSDRSIRLGISHKSNHSNRACLHQSVCEGSVPHVNHFMELGSRKWSIGLQKSAGNFSTIQNLKCVLCTAPSLTTHTPSAKGLTRSYHWSVCFGRARFADSGKICAKHLHEAYLIDAIVFALWFLFWRRSKRSPGYVYFLCRIPC